MVGHGLAQRSAEGEGEEFVGGKGSSRTVGQLGTRESRLKTSFYSFMPANFFINVSLYVVFYYTRYIL